MGLSAYVKEFFGRVQLVMKSSSASQVDVLAETDGTPKVVNYGYGISDALIPFLVEVEGEQRVVSYGKQTDLTIGAFNLNAANVLRVELINGGGLQVDPVLIPNAEGVLWDPATTSASLYEVSFNIVNSTSSDVTGVNVGVDIAAGGGLTAVEYMVQGLIVPGNGSSGWYGPFTIDGDDVIRGVAGTNNVLAIHWRVRRVYTA